MRYTYKTGIVFTLSDSADAEQHEVKLELRYTVHPGCEPTLEHPGEGMSVSILDAFVDRSPAPGWLWPFLESDQSLADEMIAHASDIEEYRHDQAAEAKREERMLERGS